MPREAHFMNSKAAKVRRDLLVAESELIRARLLRELGTCASEARGLAAEGRRMKALVDLCRAWVGDASRVPLPAPPVSQTASPWWMIALRCAHGLHTAWRAFKARDTVERGPDRLRAPDLMRNTVPR